MNTFLQQIYTVIYQIPSGRITTYGQVARMAGYPGYARQVGKALSQLPAGSKLPWYRVVNSRGMISLSGSDFDRQRQELINDGIPVSATGRISLKQYLWQP